jgi:hypothetical protein
MFSILNIGCINGKKANKYSFKVPIKHYLNVFIRLHLYIILIALRKWNSNIKIKIIVILYNNVFNGGKFV